MFIKYMMYKHRWIYEKNAQNGEFHMFFSGLNMRRKHDPDLWLTFMKPLQKNVMRVMTTYF